MDGSGKSTQIERLCADLANAGFTVKRMEFWNNVVAFSSLRAEFSRRVLQSDGEVGRPDKPAKRNDKNARKWYLTLGRHILYLFDSMKLRGVVAKARRSKADVIVFDRYIYDQLATLPLERSLTRGYVNLLLKFTYKPDVAYVLDAIPEVARARKPEYPLDFMHRYRQAYLRLSKTADLVVIHPGELEQVRCAIAGKLEPHLGFPISGTSFTATIPA